MRPERGVRLGRRPLLLRRLSLRGRLVVGVAVLATFGVLTRWETSVVGPVAMAGLTLGAATIGRPSPSLRILALATTALVLIAPCWPGLAASCSRYRRVPASRWWSP